MEHSDLNSPSSDDARLDPLLRTHLALDPLPDDGFSHRVTTAALAQQPIASLRYWICLAGLAAGVGVAVAALPSPQEWQIALPAFDGDATESFHQLTTAPVLGAALLTVGSLAYAFGLRWPRLAWLLRR